MLAKLAGEIPLGAFLYEPKGDRFRAIVFRGGPEVFIQSRDLRRDDRGRVPGLSGLRAEVSCVRGEVDVHVARDSDRAIGSAERLVIATPEYSTGSLCLRGTP